LFLHLGADKMIKLRDLIVIINNENPQKNNNIGEFFEKAQHLLEVEKIEKDNHKSIVITDDKIYFSPISSQTLKKRANFVADLGD